MLENPAWSSSCIAHLWQLLTSPVFGFETIKYPHKPLNTAIKGSVTNAQNGQHGPATTIGLPSFFSSKKNIDPTRRAQQQKYLLKSSIVNVSKGWRSRTGPDEFVESVGGCLRSACSRSHLTDTAYLKYLIFPNAILYIFVAYVVIYVVCQSYSQNEQESTVRKIICLQQNTQFA
jgi:hypothetical protein